MSLFSEREKDWLASCFGSHDIRYESLQGGKNNRAFKVLVGTRAFFLKQYFQDNEQRYQRETSFLRIATEQGISEVPVLLYTSQQVGMSVMTFVQGKPPATVHFNYLTQAARFIRQINQIDERTMQNYQVLTARGALLSGDDFLRDIQTRIEDLQQALSNKTLLGDRAVDFLRDKLLPTYSMLKEDVLKKHNYWGDFKQVLSPSDFGYHNALVDHDAEAEGKLRFFDFEYSGWDSLEKLVTDFFCQPRYCVDEKQLYDFIKLLLDNESDDGLLDRCQSLLPLARLKWSLIFLNDFKSVDNLRRQFSGTNATSEQHLSVQLRKAQRNIELIEKSLPG